jgi:hypothetical protein
MAGSDEGGKSGLAIGTGHAKSWAMVSGALRVGMIWLVFRCKKQKVWTN